VGVSLELIQKRRNEKSDVRVAARENALRCVASPCRILCCARILLRQLRISHCFLSPCSEIKERVKKAKAEKTAVKKTQAAVAPKASKAAGGAPKGQAKSGKRF
jgi:hypothetical protein